MIRLKKSVGVNWFEKRPDDPAKPGGGLGGMSLVDSNNLLPFG